MVSCPPFQGKGGLRDHFLGVLAQCELLGHFGVILGAFWGLKPQNLLNRESAKSHRNGPLTPNGGSKMLKNSKFDPLVECILSDLRDVEFGRF